MTSHAVYSVLIGTTMVVVAGVAMAQALTPKQILGKQLFFDATLSTPPGQGCFSCHVPTSGFADPVQDLPVSKGVIPGLVGSRNAPSAAYAAFSPAFHFDPAEQHYVGGQFWDGRAATLEEQAKGPFLNPVEMANPDKAAVLASVQVAAYAEDFRHIYGKDAFADVDQAYEYVADAIAAYERSAEVSPFSSKYDAYLRGEVQLSEQEMRGLSLFIEPEKGNCAACHPVVMEGETPPLLTDFTYDNLGTPRHPQNPFYQLPVEFNPDGAAFIDKGLGGPTKDPAQNGKHKVPTLRNIALTAPYMHNGVFKTLKETVDFYNTRDTDPRWAAPEIAENVNKDELGNLGLSDSEVDDIVVFMLTLTDGYRP